MNKISDITHKVTEEEAKIFEDEVWYWIDRLGLNSWQVQVGMEDNKNRRAACYTKTIGRMANIRLSEEWEEVLPVEPWQFAQTAFHEVCELLLAPLQVLCEQNSTQDQKDDSEAQSHIIIRTLENILWKPDWDGRHLKNAIKITCDEPGFTSELRQHNIYSPVANLPRECYEDGSYCIIVHGKSGTHKAIKTCDAWFLIGTDGILEPMPIGTTFTVWHPIYD